MDTCCLHRPLCRPLLGSLMAGFTGFGLAQISQEECVLEVVTFSTVKVFYNKQ